MKIIDKIIDTVTKDIIFTTLVIGALSIMTIAITVPVPKNRKITGTVKVYSFILAGSVVVPYPYDQPIYDCTKQS